MKKFFIRIWNFFRKLFGFSHVEPTKPISSSSSISARTFHKVPRLICPPDVYGVQYVANKRYY